MQLPGDEVAIEVVRVEVYEGGRLPEVYSTMLESFFPVTVRTYNTPPPPADTTGTRVVVVDNVRAPAPMETDTPLPKVYPVWVQSVVLCDVLVDYTIVIKDTDQGVDFPANSMPEGSLSLFVSGGLLYSG